MYVALGDSGMIIIKMGGSVITDKSVPLSFRKSAVRALAGAVSDIAKAEPVILVHGGGSFGHHYSVKYDMHTKPDRYDLEGFAVVRNSMVTLNGMVLDELVRGGLRPYACPPSVIVYSGDAPYRRPDEPGNDVAGKFFAIPERVQELAAVADSGLCPVLYGDAMWRGNHMSYILSGDVIMYVLSAMLRPRLAVFAMDVDGLYTDPESGDLVRRVGSESARFATGSSKTREDVTGGMARKVQVAGQIAAAGMDVFFVNGNRPERLSDMLHGRYEGTLFSRHA